MDNGRTRPDWQMNNKKLTLMALSIREFRFSKWAVRRLIGENKVKGLLKPKSCWKFLW
jgi:hypothetical protein